MKGLLKVNSLSLLVLLFIVTVLLFLVSSSSTTHSRALSSSYITEDYTIELISPDHLHHALQNSDFLLQITPASNAVANNNDSPSSDKPQPKLNSPVITLHMLHMSCGTVTSIAQETSAGSYLAEAAPLMKGSWVATATFELEGTNDQTIVLSYPFEVL